MTIEDIKQQLDNNELTLVINKKTGNIRCNFIGQYQIQTYPVEKETAREITFEEYLAFVNGEKIINETLNGFIDASPVETDESTKEDTTDEQTI